MPFLAKFKGTCTKCKAAINVGEPIEGKLRNYKHAECPDLGRLNCLLCPKPAVKQKFPFGEDTDAEGFLIAYDRGCGSECNCDGKIYHINDFCSLTCMSDAVDMFEAEK